ncbi:unnamed protein product [Urochloa humidicola]
MEDLTLVDPVDGGAVAARPGSVAASGSGGSSGAGQATAARRRTPGRWRRIPRATGRSTECTPANQLPAGEEEVRVTPATEPAGQIQDAMLRKELKELEEVRRLAPTLTSSGWKSGTLDKEGLQMTISQWTKDRLSWKTPGVIVALKGSKESVESTERGNQAMLERARELEEEDEDLCDSEEAKIAFRAFKTKFAGVYRRLATTKPEDIVFKHKPPSDTFEEQLTAEDMEMQANRCRWPVCPQAQHFATLALQQYNSSNKMHGFEMAKVLLSKCFTEVDGMTFANVNFTATPQRSTSHSVNRLFFAELTLDRGLQECEDTEPMRVLHVCTIDDSCFGK